MQQLNDRVYTETTVRGCNPSFVITSAGTVVIDTPQLPTKAVETPSRTRMPRSSRAAFSELRATAATTPTSTSIRTTR